MALRHLMIAGVFAAVLAAPAVASAATGHTTGSVSLRAGPGVQYARVAVIPAGARIEVYGCSRWCTVSYQAHRGWVSAKYVAMGGFYRQPSMLFRPPPPPFGYHVRPWWDDRYDAWYDGQRWYRDGRWYGRPTFSFEFRFGR